MNRLRNFLVLGVVVLAIAGSSWGQVMISVSFGPPAVTGVFPASASRTRLHLGAGLLGMESRL